MKTINNAGLKSRVKQVVVLVIVILLGIIISHAVSGQDFNRAKSKHFKSKYKAQIKWASHACSTIEKNRTKEPAKSIFAFLKSKPKYKPQAEVDAPSWASRQNSNKIRKEDNVVAQQQ